MRELGYRIDRDLAGTSEALHISVSLVERDAFNAERRKRSLGVPLWNCRWRKLVAYRLTDDEPSGSVNKARECVLVV